MVLVSGGARGAYQAGALSVLLPALAEQGRRPTIFAGTSAGALNAVFAAGGAHLDPHAQAEGLLAAWRKLRKRDVLLPVWLQTPRITFSYLGEVLGVPGLRLRGLLGVEPLGRALQQVMDLPQVHRNIDDGLVDAVAAIATAVRSNTSVAFVDSVGPVPVAGAAPVRWAGTRIGVEHALASAAIPLLMPAVQVTTPTDMRGWYADGSVSLQTPLRPALDLGADRLAVVGLTPLTPPEGSADAPVDPRPDEPPDLADGASALLDALLDDALVADLRWLGERGAATDTPEVPHLVVAPGAGQEIADLALEVLDHRYRGLRALRHPDFPLIHRLLGGQSSRQGELLSYLLFDGDFIDALIDLGARDARRRLDEGGTDGPWRTGPPDPFT